jgi:hypothetical protein
MSTDVVTGESMSLSLEQAHRRGVAAAASGLQDAALGGRRLTGPGVLDLADAAVTSATPFLRAPLLARMSQVLLLHRPPVETGAPCPVCHTQAPCQTYRTLQW